jgi:hypothetical protein
MGVLYHFDSELGEATSAYLKGSKGQKLEKTQKPKYFLKLLSERIKLQSS